ncbi:MAG: mechanosensitive ion channel family protein [Clostridia bacterium]|nr:mechanosensitive ion channel family protein [Clostridia bacterium]
MDEFLKAAIKPNIIISVIVGILFIIAYILVNKAGIKYAKKHKNDNDNQNVSRTLFGVLRVGVLAVGIIAILQINNINITGMVAGLGIVSAIVGLALQDYLKDIIMGVHIVSDHFFSVGECVEYEGREGTIIGFNLKTTKIGDLDDHSVITVCNRNISMVRRLADRLDIDVPLSYNEMQITVKDALTDICESIKEIDGVENCEYKGTQSFEKSSVTHRIRVYCGPNNRADVRRKTLETIKVGLDNRDIHIPFDQLDVHCNILK